MLSIVVRMVIIVAAAVAGVATASPLLDGVIDHLLPGSGGGPIGRALIAVAVGGVVGFGVGA